MTPTQFRRNTSNFGGNLEEIGLVLLNKVKEDEQNDQLKNDLKVGNDGDNKAINLQKNMSSKIVRSLENTKSVSFKDEEVLPERIEDNIKMRKPPALLKSTSIRRYEYPTLLNEDV